MLDVGVCTSCYHKHPHNADPPRPGREPGTSCHSSEPIGEDKPTLFLDLRSPSNHQVGDGNGSSGQGLSLPVKTKGE